MRAINALDNKIDAKLCGIENCLWGPNRDDGLVTESRVHSQRICRLERIVYGVVAVVCTVISGVATALLLGAI